MSDTEANRENKDRLFRFIFANPENRDWTLSLYNAVNGSAYTDADEIQITTVENAIYLTMKNDLSFLLADTMSFYEHQSTFNPNMPMRMFIYAGMVYSKYVETHKDTISLYSSSQQRFPVPKLVCFYNGLAEQPDSRILKLQDAFPDGTQADIDARVTMLNINHGRNRTLMESCKPLAEYSIFVESVRHWWRELHDMDSAVTMAVEGMADDSVIKGLLLAHMSEVRRMCITEYDEKSEREFLRNEGKAEGLAEGRALEAERMSSLILKLKNLGRVDDVFRVASDSAFRETLYKEFNL